MKIEKIKTQIQQCKNRGDEEETYPDAMLETVELPAGVSDLNSGLTNVDWNALSHLGVAKEE